MERFTDESLLPLSGLQHFAFCKRQWALIHIERQWEESVRTVEGRHLHEKVHSGIQSEVVGEVVFARSVPLVSYTLGLYGVADVVEYHRAPDGSGVRLEGRDGFWRPHGSFFYGQTRRRQVVKFSSALRRRVSFLAREMHDMFVRGVTPPPHFGAPSPTTETP